MGGKKGRGWKGRTSDSPADQRRSMSVNVRGAARTRRGMARVRRVRVVGRKCIFDCWWAVWFELSMGSCSCSCGLVSVEDEEGVDESIRPRYDDSERGCSDRFFRANDFIDQSIKMIRYPAKQVFKRCYDSTSEEMMFKQPVHTKREETSNKIYLHTPSPPLPL